MAQLPPMTLHLGKGLDLVKERRWAAADVSRGLSQPAHQGRDSSEAAVRVNLLRTAWQNPPGKVPVPVLALNSWERPVGPRALITQQPPSRHHPVHGSRTKRFFRAFLPALPQGSIP